MWTEELVAELIRLWQAGHSASRIGSLLGVSKNAVIGKAHRLKLPPRPSPIKQGAPKKLKRVPAPKVVARKIHPAPRRYYSSAVQGSSCLWPIGDPREPGFHFCGGQAVPGKPYCAEHVSRAYVHRTQGDIEAA
jgi:GcrA cell cycle regulator